MRRPVHLVLGIDRGPGESCGRPGVDAEPKPRRLRVRQPQDVRSRRPHSVPQSACAPACDARLQARRVPAGPRHRRPHQPRPGRQPSQEPALGDDCRAACQPRDAVKSSEVRSSRGVVPTMQWHILQMCAVPRYPTAPTAGCLHVLYITGNRRCSMHIPQQCHKNAVCTNVYLSMTLVRKHHGVCVAAARRARQAGSFERCVFALSSRSACAAHGRCLTEIDLTGSNFVTLEIV